jgi:Lar family restriction alleviation protein|nr:MAG TPA: Protein of unknown function (DUF551) [Caudoviricetes sp.]
MSANIAELRSKLNLKPCPFCGHEPLLAREMLTTDLRYIWGTGYRIYCPECEIAEARDIEAEEAAEKWNRRAPEWVSTKKAVPVDGNEYLVAAAGRFGIARYSLAGNWKTRISVIGYEVTHWREISKDWIPVSETLPAEEGRYLVMYGYDCVFAGYDGNGEWMTDDLCNISRLVTHWQPVPEAPKEDEEDE